MGSRKNDARLEDRESAQKYAEMLPFMPNDCAPNVLRENRLLPDEEKLPSYQQGVQDHVFLLCQYLFDIADPNYTNPLCKLTIPERVEILEQIITIVKTVYGKDLHAKYYLLYHHTRVIGALWLFGKDFDRALDAFEMAYEYAVLFKTSYKDGDCYTSPALKGVEAQPQSQFHYGADTALNDLYHRFTTQKRYHALAEHPRFAALMEKLKA